MSKVCFGFLDQSENLSIPFVADKARQLTRLSVAKHFQLAPSYEATSVDQILNWFFKQEYDYLVIIKYGVLIADNGFVDLAIRDLQEHHALVKGEVSSDGNRYYLDDNLVIISRSVFETLMYPTWGEEGYELISPTQILVGDITTKQILTGKGLQPAVMTRGGWGLIHASLRFNLPVLTWSIDDYQCFSDLEPHVGTGALCAAIINPTINNLSKLTLGQLSLLATYSFAHSSRRFVEVFNTGNSPGVCGTQIEIRKLYAHASGFRPLQILHECGFTDGTEITYFSEAESEIAFRRLMIERWDGTDFPTFLNQCAYDMHFQFNVDINQAEAWEAVLKTFGGPRAFKVFWDKYRRLKHSYRCLSVIEEPEHLLVAITDDPRSYLWWGDAFARLESHLEFEAPQLSERFCWFINAVRKRNPNMVLEGRNSYGLWL